MPDSLRTLAEGWIEMTDMKTRGEFLTDVSERYWVSFGTNTPLNQLAADAYAEERDKAEAELASLRAQCAEKDRYLLSDEERRKLTGDVLHAERISQIDTQGRVASEEKLARCEAELIAAKERIAELEKQLSELTEQYKLFIDRTIEHAAEHTMRTSARIAELDGRLAQRCACGRTSAGKLFFVEGAEWVHTAVLCQPVHSTRIAELEGALKVILRIAAEDDEDVGAQLNDIELKASLALSLSGGAT